MKKVTLQMVADKAGVSRGTVDRVLHNRSYVDEDVRQRVMSAMLELRYRPVHDSVPLKRKVCLGILVPTWSEFFNREIMRGIRDFQKDYKSELTGLNIRIWESDLPSEANDKIRELIDAGSEGIAIATQENSTTRELVQSLHRRNLPVILYNSDISQCNRLLYVGPDVEKTGRVAANLMAKSVSPDKRVLIVLGSDTIFSHRERSNGFYHKMKEYGFRDDQLIILHAFNDYTAFQKITETVGANPDIRGIYLAYDVISGCMEALESLNLTGKVHVITHDMTETARTLLTDYKIDFVIEQNIYLESYLSLKALKEHLQEPSVPVSCEAFSSIQFFCAESISD